MTIAIILTTLGGLGLFLIGMQVMSEGLRALAGDALRRVLIGFTRTPVSGALTGAATTALIQSSSATTVLAVGFVGAGLLSFQQALGIIFGANIGTTVTGWIVALIGFKLNLTTAVLPLVFVGALMRLFAPGRLSHAGWALAGFSLIFMGIATLQAGLSGLEETVTPQSFPADGVFGRLQLVLIGMVITIITQSSSAGVATALVALSVGAISFPQAAAMVIGMDVGTTFTAALATLGGSTAAQRTGYAHVIYNVCTGVMAFLLLTPYVALAGHVWALDAPGEAQVALVAFHTGFNALGVALVLCVTRPFAELVMRLVPERGPVLQRRLDEALLKDGEAATDALIATTRDVAQALFKEMSHTLAAAAQGRHLPADRWTAIGEAIDQASDYAHRIRTDPKTRANRRLQSALHALDHLTRLYRRCTESERIRAFAPLQSLAHDVETLGTRLRQVTVSGDQMGLVEGFDTLRRDLRERREGLRERVIDAAARGEMKPASVIATLSGVRWLHRCTYHVWRICFHLNNAQSAEPVFVPGAEERARGPSADED